MNTPHKHAELIKAWADGAEIEVYNWFVEGWLKVENPVWMEDKEYRVKPQKPKWDPPQVGSRWRLCKSSPSYNGGDEFLLAAVDNRMLTLISLLSGHRWRNPVRVCNSRKITLAEWEEIVGKNEFIRI